MGLTAERDRQSKPGPTTRRRCHDRLDRCRKAVSGIEATGRVPGIDSAEFPRIAEETGQGCPIAGAISGNVEISVNATLES